MTKKKSVLIYVGVVVVAIIIGSSTVFMDFYFFCFIGCLFCLILNILVFIMDLIFKKKWIKVSIPFFLFFSSIVVTQIGTIKYTNYIRQNEAKRIILSVEKFKSKNKTYPVNLNAFKDSLKVEYFEYWTDKTNQYGIQYFNIDNGYYMYNNKTKKWIWVD